jgi:hypothetical protein
MPTTPLHILHWRNVWHITSDFFEQRYTSTLALASTVSKTRSQYGQSIILVRGINRFLFLLYATFEKASGGILWITKTKTESALLFILSISCTYTDTSFPYDFTIKYIAKTHIRLYAKRNDKKICMVHFQLK